MGCAQKGGFRKLTKARARNDVPGRPCERRLLHGELVGLLWLRENPGIVPAMNCCKIFDRFACKRKLRKWITTTLLVHVRLTLILPHPRPLRLPVSLIFLDPTGSSICLSTTIVVGAQYNLVDSMPEKFDEMLQRWHEATVDEVLSNFLPEEPQAVEVRASSPSSFPPALCLEISVRKHASKETPVLSKG